MYSIEITDKEIGSNDSKLNLSIYDAWANSTMMNKVAIFAWLVILTRCAGAGPEEWPVYQGFGSNQYSGLDQINRSNVHRLEVAWTYRTGDSDPDNRSQIQANPIVVDGILYATSAQLKVFALDATTGLHRWTFDPFASSALETEGRDNGYDLFGAGVSRGVTYWEDGEDRRIFWSAHYNIW